MKNQPSELSAEAAEVAVRDVLTRYSLNVDLHRDDRAVLCWTEDCEFLSDAPGPTETIRGRDGLKRFLTSPAPFGPRTLHLQLDYTVRVRGDTAEATGYQGIIVPGEKDYRIARAGFRIFYLKLVNGNWLIHRSKSIRMENDAEVSRSNAI